MTGRAQTPRRAARRRTGATPLAPRARVFWASLRRLAAPLRLCQLLILAVVGLPVSAQDGIADTDAVSHAQARSGPDASSNAGLPGFVGNPVAEVPLDRLSATRDRPLFSPSRHPAFLPPVAAKPRNEQASRPPPPVPSPSVALFGIIVGAHGPRAFIGTEPTNPIVGVQPGDDVNGWTVTTITERALVLSRADLSATFMLFSPENASLIAHFGSGTPAQPFAPVQPVQQSPQPVQPIPGQPHRRGRVR
jgi:hypothetical protein